MYHITEYYANSDLFWSSDIARPFTFDRKFQMRYTQWQPASRPWRPDVKRKGKLLEGLPEDLEVEEAGVGGEEEAYLASEPCIKFFL